MKKCVLNLILFFSFISISYANPLTQEILKQKLTTNLEQAHIYEKFKRIKARPALNNEKIITYTNDGKETKNIAKLGDMVIENQTDAKEQYILTKTKFEKRYQYEKEAETPWKIYKPLGKIRALKVNDALLLQLNTPSEFEIIANWGEKMVVKKGDFLVAPLDISEIYRIAEKEFFETYQIK